MNLAQNEATVGQLVVERPSRARVFERLGIDYCCGGKLPLREACQRKHLDYDAVLTELEQEQAAPSESARNWAAASLTELCDHIEQTHHAYLKEELPRLEFLTKKVAARHGDNRPALLEIQELFAALKVEMEDHMMKEERIFFPYCRTLDAAVELPPTRCGGAASPIEVLTREHEDAGDALVQFRALTGNYTCPQDACNTFRAMYDGLQHLERDMHEHVHKENNILFPRAIQREKMVSAKKP